MARFAEPTGAKNACDNAQVYAPSPGRSRSGSASMNSVDLRSYSKRGMYKVQFRNRQVTQTHRDVIRLDLTARCAGTYGCVQAHGATAILCTVGGLSVSRVRASSMSRCSKNRGEASQGAAKLLFKTEEYVP